MQTLRKGALVYNSTLKAILQVYTKQVSMIL